MKMKKDCCMKGADKAMDKSMTPTAGVKNKPVGKGKNQSVKSKKGGSKI